MVRGEIVTSPAFARKLQRGPTSCDKLHDQNNESKYQQNMDKIAYCRTGESKTKSPKYE